MDIDFGFLLGDFVAGTAAIYLVERASTTYDTKIVQAGSAIAAAAVLNYFWMPGSLEMVLLHAGIGGGVAWFLYPYVFQFIFNHL
jgi:hypothetical protein